MHLTCRFEKLQTSTYFLWYIFECWKVSWSVCMNRLICCEHRQVWPENRPLCIKYRLFPTAFEININFQWAKRAFRWQPRMGLGQMGLWRICNFNIRRRLDEKIYQCKKNNEIESWPFMMSHWWPSGWTKLTKMTHDKNEKLLFQICHRRSRTDPCLPLLTPIKYLLYNQVFVKAWDWR